MKGNYDICGRVTRVGINEGLIFLVQCFTSRDLALHQ